MTRKAFETNNAEFLVVVSPSTFDMSKHGSVTGVVYVKTGASAFPDDHWSDFVVVVMSWWLPEVTSLQTGSSRTCSCNFMDGPFRFDIEALRADVWNCKLFGASEEKRPMMEVLVKPDSIISTLLSASELVIKTCDEKGWNVADLNTLKANRLKLMSTTGLT